MPSSSQRRAKMNKNREKPWRPQVVFADGNGGVNKHGMAEIFQSCHDEAEGLTPNPDDIVFLDEADIPGATPLPGVSAITVGNETIPVSNASLLSGAQ